MLNHEDLKWIAATSTELNSLLQQISRYADLARQHKGQQAYLEMLTEKVDVAAKHAQELFDRVTSQIMRGAAVSGAAAPAKPQPATAPARFPNLAVVRDEKPERGAVLAMPSPATADPVGAIRINNSEGTRELIMVIDDEPEIGDLACAMLADEGYRVIVARDGFEALKIYQQASKQIGLVILDFFLPVMDGDAVFEELKAINPAVNVVLSSGFAEQNKIGAMLAQGLRGFIPKPYSREKLLDQVRQTLDAAGRSMR